MAGFGELPAELGLYIVAIVAQDSVETRQGWVAALCRTSRAIDAVVRPILVETVVVGSKRACRRLGRACAARADAFRRTRNVLLTVPHEHVGSSRAVDALAGAFAHVRGFGGPLTLFHRLVLRPAFAPQFVVLTTPCTLRRLLAGPTAATLARVSHLHVFMDALLQYGQTLWQNEMPSADLMRRMRVQHVILDFVGTVGTDGALAAADLFLKAPGLQSLLVRNASGADGWAQTVQALREHAQWLQEPRIWTDSGTAERVWRDYSSPSSLFVHPTGISFDGASWGAGGQVQCALGVDGP